MVQIVEWDQPTGSLGAVLSLFVDVLEQDVASNTSLVLFRSGLFNVPGATNHGSPVACTLTGDGVNVESTFTWAAGTPEKILISTQVEIEHDPDGAFSGQWQATIGATGTQGIGGPTSTGLRGGEFPTILRGPHLRVGGSWRRTVMFLKVAGVHRQVIPWAKDSGAWKRGVG